MKNQLDITPEQLKIVKEILQKNLQPHAKIWIFGSRAKGTAKKTSDLDLAIDIGEPLTLKIFANLNEDFTESLLPYKVDIVDWNSISESFRERIKKGCVLLALA